MKKTLTIISTTFLTMTLANSAQAMNITLSVDNFGDSISAPLKVFMGSESETQNALPNVMGGERITELSVDTCTSPRLECAVLDIAGNMELLAAVTEAAGGEIRASVQYPNLMGMDGSIYTGFLVELDSDLEALENVTFELLIDSDSDVSLDSPMILDGNDLFFDFADLTGSELSSITSLQLSTFAQNSAYDYIINGIGFTVDLPPNIDDVPEPSGLISLASILGLALFFKGGKKQA